VEGSPSCEEGGGRVYVGCYDSRLYCLDKRTGQIVWSFQAQVNNKSQFTFPLASIKGVQATGEAFSPKKRTSSTSKPEISQLFPNFVGHF
jgi:outer membrane protein assembly factor BamB